MIFKINKREIFQNLSFSFFLLLFGFLCIYFNSFVSNIFDVSIIILIILILVSISIILFIDYLKNSTRGTIIIHDSFIEIDRESGLKIVNKGEIKEAKMFAAPSIKRKSAFKLLPFETFHYVEIKCKDGQKIIITSLSDSHLYESISKKSLFKGVLVFNNGGLSGNGSLINSIWWNGLK